MLNNKWIAMAVFVPIFTMMLGVFSYQYIEMQRISLEERKERRVPMCVVAISTDIKSGLIEVDIMATPDGGIHEQNKVGLFVMPCHHDGAVATLHSSKKKGMLGAVRLKLSQSRMFTISNSSVQHYENLIEEFRY